MADQKDMSVFDSGDVNPYNKFFTGISYLKMLSTEQVPVGNVTFEPGCRNHWHIHHATQGGGQILLVTAGRGWYQEWHADDREALELYWSYIALAQEGRKRYQETYGPILQTDTTPDSYRWLNDPWPWDEGGNS